MIYTISSVNIIEVTWTAVGTCTIEGHIHHAVTVVSTSAIIEIDNTTIGTIVGHIHHNCCECYYRNRYY